MHLVEALGYAVLQDGTPEGGCDGCVCGDDSKHGGHVRVDHARPLGNAPDAYGAPADAGLHSTSKMSGPGHLPTMILGPTWHVGEAICSRLRDRRPQAAGCIPGCSATIPGAFVQSPEACHTQS